jgi:sulfate permease, SulP family
MPALVAIMIMVSIGTFSWRSLNDLRNHPRRSSLVMLATVITVVGTHNLALGVGVGVLLSGIFFAWKVAQIFRVSSVLTADGKERDYLVEGQLFFASTEDFLAAFDFKEKLERVRLDLSQAHIWDLTGVNAVDQVVLKFRREGTTVELVGMNEASATIMDDLAVHDQPDAIKRVLGH